MKTLELNIGLHSKTQGELNPSAIINSLTGRGFVVMAYRVEQSQSADGQEPCLAVRVAFPSHPTTDSALRELDSLARDYGQDCIALAGFAGDKPYAEFNGAYWVTVNPPAMSECEAMQAKHRAAGERALLARIISGMPDAYRDLLYQASALAYHSRNTGTQSNDVRP